MTVATVHLCMHINRMPYAETQTCNLIMCRKPIEIPEKQNEEKQNRRISTGG